MTADTLVSHPLADRLTALRLPGMRAAFLEQIARRDLADMAFEDRLALLVDRELSERRTRALQRRLKKARLHHHDACFEAIDLGRGRGLDRSLILGLADCRWIQNGANILITGPCGTGKSWIACALAHKACLEGYQALYLRLPRLLTQLRIAHGEGTIPKLYHDLARLDLLILDDWGLAPIDAPRRRDILEILDDRYNRRSIIVTSQIPVPDWHRQLNDPTIAEAILDRLVHTAYRIELSGPSMRADRSSPAIQKNSA